MVYVGCFSFLFRFFIFFPFQLITLWQRYFLWRFCILFPSIFWIDLPQSQCFLSIAAITRCCMLHSMEVERISTMAAAIFSLFRSFSANTLAYRKPSVRRYILAECVYYANIVHVPAFQFDISIFLDLRKRERFLCFLCFFSFILFFLLSFN